MVSSRTQNRQRTGYHIIRHKEKLHRNTEVVVNRIYTATQYEMQYALSLRRLMTARRAAACVAEASCALTWLKSQSSSTDPPTRTTTSRSSWATVLSATAFSTTQFHEPVVLRVGVWRGRGLTHLHAAGRTQLCGECRLFSAGGQNMLQNVPVCWRLHHPRPQLPIITKRTLRRRGAVLSSPGSTWVTIP